MKLFKRFCKKVTGNHFMKNSKIIPKCQNILCMIAIKQIEKVFKFNYLIFALILDQVTGIR